MSYEDKSKNLKLDGNEYILTKYPARKGLKLLAKLSKILGEPLGYVLSQDMDKNVDPQMIGKGLSLLFNNIDPDDFVDLCEEIFNGQLIVIKGQNIDINDVLDVHFAGESDKIMSLVFEVLKFQYQNFLAKVATVTPTAAATTKTVNKIQAK